MRKPTVGLDGALVLVTGAGSGIGRATALAFAGAGSRVLCADIDLAAAEKTVGECAERGPAAHAYAADVADASAMDALAGRVHAEHGPLDVLVNNAGVGVSGSFLDTSLDDWDWILSINLRGVVHGCHAFGPAMVERGSGHVINMSSGLAYTPTATESAYGTTKAAVLELSRCLRADWHRHGVAVTAVCPGVIDTDIIERTRFRGRHADPERVARTRALFRRGHSPDVVARAVLDAVRTNPAVKTAGFEAALGWWLHRLLPTSVGDVVARRVRV